MSIDENNTILKKENAKTFLETNPIFDMHIQKIILPNEYDENHFELNPLIKLNAISVQYNEKKVLNKVNWTINSGEFWQLVGPNGCGKSTLISIICGDNPQGYGQDLILFGKKKGSGESIWDIKRQIGYFTRAMIAQFKHVDTVENMIVSGLFDTIGLYTKPSEMQYDIAKSWIEMMGVGFRNKTFPHLSVGQQRMVMVARAMVKHPPLLILDEPTIELDDENSILFIEMINAIVKEKKTAILYVSHRDEPNLKPDKIFELFPTNDGSVGIVRE